MQENDMCQKALTAQKKKCVSHLSLKNNKQIQKVILIHAFRSLSGVLCKAKKEWYKICPRKINESVQVSLRSA